LSAAGRVRKGKRVENEIVALHEAIGVPACKVLRSGALANKLGPDFAGDVKLWPRGAAERPLIGEVKSRSNGDGFATIERWLSNHDVLFLKRNGKPPLVVLPWSTWASVLTRGEP
jgi:hypothetical protein